MKNIEINGNLEEEKDFLNFFDIIQEVLSIFINVFGIENMSKIDLLIDNATKKSGYTPITTVILKKYIIIKLGVDDFAKSEQIVYQFAHELCHYVFYSLKGLNKPLADREEENICSAMSLILINILYPNKIKDWLEYVDKLQNENYNNGGNIARECNFDIKILKERILKICNKKI